ncbi:MAG: hypothetical protein AAB509_03275 [Patescibacteria group bacterium]
MDKKTIIIVAVAVLAIILITGAGYFLWPQKPKSDLENASDTAEKISDSATRGVLPSLETNPLKNKPNVNPADNANPIKNIKVNPFD